MDSARLSKYRSALVEMRDRLIPDLSRIEQAVAEDAHPPGEISNAPTHLGNIASTNPEGNIALAHAEQGILEQVQAALERIDNGGFGLCEECGGKISRERLDALPYTPYCIHCAQQQEQQPR